MTDPEKSTFRKKLDELSARLHARANEFRQKGEFSDTHEALLNRIQQHHEALSKKVAEAEAKGTTWDLVKTELERDYSALFDNLLEFEERLDTESMRGRKE
jgi:hypothetical protein